jgi:hypothetical protein
MLANCAASHASSDDVSGRGACRFVVLYKRRYLEMGASYALSDDVSRGALDVFLI